MDGIKAVFKNKEMGKCLEEKEKKKKKKKTKKKRT